MGGKRGNEIGNRKFVTGGEGWWVSEKGSSGGLEGVERLFSL